MDASWENLPIPVEGQSSGGGGAWWLVEAVTHVRC